MSVTERTRAEIARRAWTRADRSHDGAMTAGDSESDMSSEDEFFDADNESFRCAPTRRPS
eukprot:31323-Pelagococcus_subviridis.AAC.6